MALKDLNKLGIELQTKFINSFTPQDIVLPNSFKETVKELGGYKYNYKKYSVHISSDILDGYIPNQWFIIASYFVDFHKELIKYKDTLVAALLEVGVNTAEERKKLLTLYTRLRDEKAKTKDYTVAQKEATDEVRNVISSRLLNSSLNENDKELIVKFVSDYTWWFGGKTIDRGDFYVSPILGLAKVVNASHSYIAEICKFLSDNNIDVSGLTVPLGSGETEIISEDMNIKYRPYITAIKSKPFLLLAGISGTGKSRIVRELARACWEEGSEEYKAQKPRNFEMVQVKPNWHDSSELLGYVSRIGADKDGNGVTFIAGDFLKFIARAWEEQDVPYFLCLDEMNLAPVEQYFAEYLSVVESRKATDEGVVTDPILRKSIEPWYFNLCAELTSDDDLRQQFLSNGICIPQNLIVIGTVNMDETTFSFSRKVLDRAMTIEMNEVDLEGGLTDRYEAIGQLGTDELIGTCVEGVDVYATYKEVCDKVIAYLKVINNKLEGTPFKIAYRTRNEFLLYVVNNLPYNKDEDGKDLDQDFVIARALDEITNMKILSRIEGDETKVSKLFNNDELSNTIKTALADVCTEYDTEASISLAKLKEMKDKLENGYTSFWS